MTTAVATTRAPRLPMPANAGVDAGKWRVLVEAIFPNAESADSVMLALDYCKARGLDVMKKPVNIVPMWNSKLGRMVETIWPAITEVQVTAARTKEWAGMDPPEWGPDTTETFKGRRKTRQGWEDAQATVTFPEYCSVTVYRTIGGERCAFTEPVYWREAYGRIGGSPLPNEMWTKRPRGQLHKVAKAASLRAAFPEESDYGDEEMAGQTIDVTPAAAPATAPADNWTPPAEGDQQPEPPPHDPDTGEVGPRKVERGEQEELRSWAQRLLNHIKSSTTEDEIEQWLVKNSEQIDTFLAEAPKMHTQLLAAIGKHRVSLVGDLDQGGGQQEAPA